MIFLNLNKKAISSMALYMIIAFVLIGIILGVFYRQNLTESLINLLPGAGHTKNEPDLEANFVDEMVSDLQLKTEFVQFLNKYNFGNPQQNVSFEGGNCVAFGLKNVLNSQVPILILDSDDNILLSVKKPEGDFDLNPRTNPVQIVYKKSFNRVCGKVDFVFDGYSNKVLAGVNENDTYFDWNSFCGPDENGEKILFFFGECFFEEYYEKDKENYFCRVLSPSVNYDSLSLRLSGFYARLSVLIDSSYVDVVHGEKRISDYSELPRAVYSTMSYFLSTKALGSRSNYLESWGKVNKFGYWENPIDGLHCIDKNPYDVNSNYYCYPIYVYQEGTSAEKEYYFDYGTRTFKGVSDDSVLEILSEIGVGGKIVYFAGNQMWWAGCKSDVLLEKGYVTHVK